MANTPKVCACLQLTLTLLDMRLLDSSFYYTCCRGGFHSALPIAYKILLDFRLHIYDMTAPLSSPTRVIRPPETLSRRSAYDEPTTLKVIKVIQGVTGGWTITDAHLSPDNERSFCPLIHIACG